LTGERHSIAVTPGEPAGIGPDLCLQVLREAREADITLIADPDLLDRRMRMLGIVLDIVEYRAGAQPRPGTIAVLPVKAANTAVCGVPDPGNAPYVLETLKTAVAGCLDGRFDAMVTGPVHKGAMNRAGIRFSGHTEYLAMLTGTPDVVMMLMTPGLRVALATTHLALKDVIAAITPHRIESTLRTTQRGLRESFGIVAPRLLVCGLNPHAGEDGELGTEEIEIISPVIRKLAREGLLVSGPRPADTAFIPESLAATDAVVAMYHDQGLPVLKHMGFGDAINVTLGLPIIRTSVDHGTALELAGSGRGRSGSLELALDTAIDMARQRRARTRPD
jgi:4-hydroxythreonine-4-phosphate dehydrogenase